MKNPFPACVTTIGIAAPSGAADRGQYEASLALLRSFGLRIIEGGNLFASSDAQPYLSAPDDARADDLNALIRNPEIDLILCLRGGYGSMRILDRIDWETLRKRNLPVIGFSDITAIHLAMLARNAGLPVAGQMAAAFARSMQDSATFLSFHRALQTALHGKTAPTEQYTLTELRSGTADGGIIPVNLTLLAALCGTPYFPDLTDRLLIVEDIGEPVRKLDRHLTQLRLAGVPQKLAGLVFAQFTDCENESLRINLFRDFARMVPGPVLSGLPFGHELPSLSFVYGEHAEIRNGTLRF